MLTLVVKVALELASSNNISYSLHVIISCSGLFKCYVHVEHVLCVHCLFVFTFINLLFTLHLIGVRGHVLYTYSVFLMYINILMYFSFSVINAKHPNFKKNMAVHFSNSHKDVGKQATRAPGRGCTGTVVRR